MKHKRKQLNSKDENNFRKLSQAVERVQVKNEASGAVHSYSEPEVRAFSQYINDNLAADPLCKKYLPLEGNDLFTKLRDGVLLMLFFFPIYSCVRNFIFG